MTTESRENETTCKEGVSVLHVAQWPPEDLMCMTAGGLTCGSAEAVGRVALDRQARARPESARVPTGGAY
jgi:hypothetical protein